MGNNRILEILLRIKDEASKNLSNFNKNLERMQPTFKKMAVAGTASFVAIAAASRSFINQSLENESLQNRLLQLLKNTHDATKDQVDVLFQQAKALEKVGVVSESNIIQTQSQLATFDLQIDTIKRLTPAILDYVTAEKGATATTEDFKQMTNGLAQALQGNFASLTRTGFVLDDATKALIENGTEAERSAALVEVLNSTYKDFNANLANTTEGGLQVLRNRLDQIKQSIGDALIPVLNTLVSKIKPVIDSFAQWAEKNPEMVRKIIEIGLVISGLVAILGTLGVVLPGITAGLSFLLSPVGLLTVAIGALVGYLVFFRERLNEIFQSIDEKTGLITLMKEAWDNIKDSFNNYLLPALQKLWESLKPLEPFLKALAQVVGTVFVIAIGGLVKAIDGWIGIFSVLFSWVTKIATFLTGTFVSALNKIIDTIAKAINYVERLVSSMKEIGIGGTLKNVGKSILSGAKNLLGINDGIVQNGKIITTHPDDYLIATKNPSSLVSQGGGLVININGGTYLSEDVAKEMGDMIFSRLKLSNQL